MAAVGRCRRAIKAVLKLLLLLCRLNATPHTYWQTNLDGIAVGGSNASTNLTKAVFDTGTSIIVMNSPAAAAINAVSWPNQTDPHASLLISAWQTALEFLDPWCLANEAPSVAHPLWTLSVSFQCPLRSRPFLGLQ